MIIVFQYLFYLLVIYLVLELDFYLLYEINDTKEFTEKSSKD
jgi:hypothetical protein